MSDLNEAEYIVDPRSGRLYEKSLTGLKQLFATEFPRSLPIIYAILGAGVMSGLVKVVWMLLPATDLGIPSIALPILILSVSLFWGYGGWKKGTKEQKWLDRGDEDVERVI